MGTRPRNEGEWRRRRAVVLGALACAWLVLALAGCPSGREDPPEPGYSGPVPSEAAQRALAGQRGLVFRDETGALGGGDFEIVDGFAVVPNALTGKGPVVSLTRKGGGSAPLDARQGADGHFWVPVLTDGDAADFCRRVSGSIPHLEGDTSEIYRRTLGL